MMTTRRKARWVRILLAGSAIAALAVPAGSSAQTPFRRYTFQGAGRVAAPLPPDGPGTYEIVALASGGRQDEPNLYELDPLNCFSEKNLIQAATNYIKELIGSPSASHYGGPCRHIGWGTIVVRTSNNEIISVRQTCMEMYRRANGSFELGFAGPASNGRKTYVRLIDKGGTKPDFAGWCYGSSCGGIVQQDALCGASKIPIYPLKRGQFVATDTGDF